MACLGSPIRYRPKPSAAARCMRLEQAVLERVGVLELVDHDHRVARREGAGQRRPAGSIQRRGQLLQQAVEAAPAAGQQARLALRAQVRQRRVHGLHMQRLRERRAGRGQRRRRHPNSGCCRRGDAFLAAPGGQRRIEHGRAAGARWPPVASPAAARPRRRWRQTARRRSIRFVAVVLVAAESCVPQQQSQRFIPPGRPGGDEGLHGAGQRRLPRPRIDLRRRRQQTQTRPAGQALQRAGQALRTLRPQAVQHIQQHRIGHRALPAPEIAQDLAPSAGGCRFRCRPRNGCRR